MVANPAGSPNGPAVERLPDFLFVEAFMKGPYTGPKSNIRALSLLIPTTLLFTSLLQKYHIQYHCLPHDIFQEYES